MSNKHKNLAADAVGNKSGLTVKVRNNDVDKAIRILKKKMLQEGILKDLRKHEYYEKPGDRRRREKAEATRRWRRARSQLENEW